MAHPRAAVDVVGADDRAHEFLHEVVFLIGGAGGRNTGDGVGSARLFDALEFGDDAPIGRFPGYLSEFPIVALDERRTQAIGVIEKFEGVTSFKTCMATVDFGIQGRPDGDDLVIGYGYRQVAAHAAIGANGPNYLFRLGRFGLEHIEDGCRGASLRAGATTDAIGLREGLIHSLGDMAMETSSRHGEHELPLHLVAGPNAAVAMDAFGEIGSEIRMGGIFLSIQVILATRIPDLPDADLRRHPL
uniref:Uncharacterized protein n=1 Tax=Candidatus Kentrum sp. LPFa TaxID=2126335 RepID=A0A450X1M1_9GAMM|nr:MAG: hypothetical protein BECKLPF1236A_GA0070988_103732 [Candidatus Kentron sp. LPFa]